jgi:hypothetical protein
MRWRLIASRMPHAEHRRVFSRREIDAVLRDLQDRNLREEGLFFLEESLLRVASRMAIKSGAADTVPIEATACETPWYRNLQ